MANHEVQVQPRQLLAAAHQHLTNTFFRQDKTEAKRAFNDISAGRSIPFLEISSGDKGEVYCSLALDHSEYIGKLNFSAFRDVLGAHLQLIADKLKNDENLNIFTNEQTGDLLFNIPGIMQRDGTVNVLVTGIEQRKAGELTVKLMFLDPANFIDPARVS
ncbi:MAG: hypothetical protein KJO31_10805 [Gammaproteobacteria bacterium]|nr:hypothetical protein [Gammaproteobacteria bacterium]